MNSGGNFLQQSAHRDVLEAAIPESPESKQRLLEEIKSRAKSAVSGKAWMDAKFLYEKAIEVMSGNDKELAILHSNLSLVQSKMGQFDVARDMAKIATEKDATYVKGWWRLGQALSMMENYGDAVDALEKAKTLDPTNKALIQELKKLTAKKANSAKASASEPATKTTSTTKSTTTTTTTSKSSAPATKSSASSANVEKEEGDEKTFTKSDHVKGYKIVNGKKTSFFHNELSEKDKELIGDIAPKKLDAATAPAAPAATEPSSTSAWNQAGTWEEKDVTGWAKTSFEEGLLKSKHEAALSQLQQENENWKKYADSAMLDNDAIVAAVSKVTINDGHASFATVRGKKRYIYEFDIKLEWKLSAGDDDVLAKGSMSFPDIDGTCELGKAYDMTSFSITQNNESEHIKQAMIQNIVSKSGLRNAIHQSIDDWVRKFRETY